MLSRCVKLPNVIEPLLTRFCVTCVSKSLAGNLKASIKDLRFILSELKNMFIAHFVEQFIGFR